MGEKRGNMGERGLGIIGMMNYYILHARMGSEELNICCCYFVIDVLSEEDSRPQTYQFSSVLFPLGRLN